MFGLSRPSRNNKMRQQAMNSGAHKGAVEIRKLYLGKIRDQETIDAVAGECAFLGGDFAFEYTGRDLNIYRLWTEAVA